MSDALAITLVNRRTELERLARLVEAFGDAHRLSPDMMFEINLVLDEVITNVILHGYDRDADEKILVRLELLTPPGDIVQADRKGERLRCAPHGLVRHGEQAAIVFVLHVAEAARMVRVVRLLRLHEGLGFQRRRVCVLRRFRLHELRSGEAAAVQLKQHPPVPQERRRRGHGGGAGEDEAAAFFLETVQAFCHAVASRRDRRSAWMCDRVAASSG